MENQIKKKKKNKFLEKAKKYRGKKSHNDDDEETAIARKLTAILSEDRASKQYDWIRVCWCLKNINESLFDDFVEFSKKTTDNNYTYDGCVDAWERTKVASKMD